MSDVEEIITRMMNSQSDCIEIYNSCDCKSDRKVCRAALERGVAYKDLIDPSINTAIDALKLANNLDFVFDSLSDDFKYSEHIQTCVMTTTCEPKKWNDIFQSMSKTQILFWP